MKLSVNIITRNRKNLLKRLIDSFINQMNSDIEIIILDNGGNDDCEDFIVPYLQTKKINFIYEYSIINLGVAGGRLRTFELSNGEYVVSLDDDAIVVSNNFFSEIIFKMDNNLDFFAAGIEIYEPSTKKYHGRVDTIYKGIKIMKSYAGGGHVIRKSFFENRKLYPRLLMFGSEEDFAAYQIYANGGIIPYFQEIKIQHLPDKNTSMDDKEREINFLIGSYIVRKSLFPFLWMIIEYIFLNIRIYKNGFYKRKAYIKEMIRNRYEKNYTSKLTYLQINRLIKIFGIRKIL